MVQRFIPCLGIREREGELRRAFQRLSTPEHPHPEVVSPPPPPPGPSLLSTRLQQQVGLGVRVLHGVQLDGEAAGWFLGALCVCEWKGRAARRGR